MWGGQGPTSPNPSLFWCLCVYYFCCSVASVLGLLLICFVGVCWRVFGVFVFLFACFAFLVLFGFSLFLFVSFGVLFCFFLFDIFFFWGGGCFVLYVFWVCLVLLLLLLLFLFFFVSICCLFVFVLVLVSFSLFWKHCFPMQLLCFLVSCWFNVCFDVCLLVLVCCCCCFPCFLFQDVPMLFVNVVFFVLKHKKMFWLFASHFLVLFCFGFSLEFCIFYFCHLSESNSPRRGNSKTPRMKNAQKRTLPKIAISAVVLTTSVLFFLGGGSLKIAVFAENAVKLVASTERLKHAKIILKLVQGYIKNWSKHVAQHSLDQIWTHFLAFFMWFVFGFKKSFELIPPAERRGFWKKRTAWTNF